MCQALVLSGAIDPLKMADRVMAAVAAAPRLIIDSASQLFDP